jgi:tRNA 5-methylaminomethyl-2-thiouridine biosynthesis bifunctional protein
MADNVIEWENGITPRSTIFDDVYFSTDGGIEESEAVFLSGIDALQVWQGKHQFTICELGFGTGLNFLNTADLWIKNSKPEQVLNYFATELYPLKRDDLDRALKWPEIEKIKQEFLSSYPSENLSLCDGRIKLNLLLGYSEDILMQMTEKVDAWYLDGFAPSKNPDMWTDEIFAQMARLSQRGTKIATFTAAGFVRRAMSNAGFQIYKRDGYGKKREMLGATYLGVCRG